MVPATSWRFNVVPQKESIPLPSFFDRFVFKSGSRSHMQMKSFIIKRGVVDEGSLSSKRSKSLQGMVVA